MKLYVKLAGLVCAAQNCERLAQQNVIEEEKERLRGWASKHRMAIRELAAKHLPSGSGFDAGTHLDLDRSTDERLVLTTDFHHMNDNGMYDGWTAHTITVRPSLHEGIRLTITGKKRNDIKEYIYEVFYTCLQDTEVT